MRALELVDQLKLRLINEASTEDRLRILEIRNQSGVRNKMHTSHQITEEEHFDWIERLKTANHTRFFVVYSEGAIIGGISLNAISIENKRADWGFYLDEAMQGRGFGSALAFKFLDYVFSEDFEKLNCEVLEFNTASLAFHKRFGFIDEGFRRHHILRDGHSWGAHLLGITRAEWAQRRLVLTRSDPPPSTELDGSYYMTVIDEIEQIRSKNNKNWMDLLRLSFKHAPKDAAEIVAEIYKHDQSISELAQKLSSPAAGRVP